MFHQDWFTSKDTLKLSSIQILVAVLVEPFLSLETLDRHNQTHNDIKPVNFLVKFKNGYD